MSVIYTSADTAETVNRAVKNVQGTTTITDGAAADGLIINENLKPIIQNVTTYVNPTVTKTDMGEPPLSFHAIDGSLIWSISGNVDTGVYVGESTDNLFDKSNADIYDGTNVDTELGKWNKYSGTGKTVRIAVSPATTYAISLDSNIETTVFRVLEISTAAIPDSGTPVLGNSLVSSSADNTATFTTAADTLYIVLQFTAAVFTDCINTLMLCTGSTPKPYEPFGVKIPIEFNSVTYNAYINDYLRKSTGDTPVFDIMSSDGTITRNVNSDGTPAETPTTETYTAPELNTIWGWNTFDVGTTVTPSNVSVTYKDV